MPSFYVPPEPKIVLLPDIFSKKELKSQNIMGKILFDLSIQTKDHSEIFRSSRTRPKFPYGLRRTEVIGLKAYSEACQ